ncbi:hypothetical protein [Streptomyces sp. P17]|uniref:hypothetical protein n=1 Tax=Streptomyces sp. P17 TaxID=3074716 RepID=UPI0028F40A51|nr:hypothetical protein [Streptomyces sp. P17]MDT9695252.1 hypothetical protein [Streptomyces sp. P17]
MLSDFSSLIAATARWLTSAFPPNGGALAAALCDAQARQAVTIAAWLRYPTPTDAALAGMAGSGGSARLDWITGAEGEPGVWRTWVDEVIASWAACLLADPRLAGLAVAAVDDGTHTDGAPVEFRRLIEPDDNERRAAALLRHPDLLAPVADLHRAELMALLEAGQPRAA